ncbi:MAG: carbohydrate binding domain-containing protein [Armatimonadetes bacterium]|nr:carbohydrate binding domain-containing protein [Armatimonadota bacterium]
MMPNRHSTPSAADLLVILATSALLSACAIASAEPTLANPGFEDGQAGWDAALFQRHEGLVVIDRQKGRGGNVSLRIGNRRGTENAELAQTIEGIEPGTGYEATVWVVSDGASTPILAGLRLEFLDADGKLVSRRQTRRAVGSQDWQELRLNATAGLDARKVRLRLQVFGQGTIWFDDVRLKTLGPPSGLVIEPERQRIDAGRGARVRVTARLPQPWQGESAPPFKVSANRLPDGAAHSPDIQVNQTAPDRFDISFELPSVTAGGYRITCALPDGKGLAQSMVYVPAPNRKPAGLSDDGIIMADKERFFPIGLCHVGVRSYPEVARQGFNCVQGAASLDPAALGSALKAAQDAGLLVDVPLYAGGQVRANLPASAERIRRYAQHPAVLSWKLLDQPEHHGAVADEVPEAATKLKALDGRHPFALSVAEQAGFHLWAGFCDVLQVPGYVESGQPLASVGERVAAAKGVLEPWQNLTVLLSAGWRTDPETQPSFAQARTMLYLALINGARGVFWYAYKDPGWSLAQTPLWERFKEINEETRQLSGPLLGGTKVEGPSLEPADSGVQMLAVDYGGKRYVLLANPTNEKVRVTVDTGLRLDAAPCLRGRPAEVQDGKVVLELPGPGAETLVLQEPAATPAGSEKQAQP